jgi:FemAB-related protein (PEP-CTERM system-associated)
MMPGSVPSLATGIRFACDPDRDRWEHFVSTTPEATFYHRFDWLRLNREVLGNKSHALLAEEDGEVVGVLPLTRVKSRLFGDMLVSMPFVNFGGVVARSDEVRERLINAACEVAEGLGCDYLEMRSLAPSARLASRTHKVSMTIELPDDPEDLWEAFKSKHRKNIKRAYKNDLRVEQGGRELLPDFYGQLELGWRDLGTPLYSRTYFHEMLSAFPNECRIFVAYQGETPVAGALNGSHCKTLEGMWAGGDPRYKELQPNYVLYWEMIRFACERGYRRYHLGRSTRDSGAERFKSRWMAEPEPLYWNYHLVSSRELPELNPENPKFRMAIGAWRKLPLPLTRILGPRLARLLP